MKILFLSPRQCWPTLSGAKLREYHLLRALSSWAEVTYAYFADAGAAPLTRAELPFVARIVSVPKPSVYDPWKLLRGVIGKTPLPVLNYTSAQMAKALSEIDGGYDLVHLDLIHMVRYADALRTPTIFNWHNIESEAMRRFAETTPSRMRKVYANLTASKLESLEREILADAFGHIVCSERERVQLQHIAPSARIAVIENGVDCTYFAGLDGASRRNRIVFVGKMDYYPNSDAIVRFAKDTWPAIQAQLQGLTLTVVGANPTAAVQSLASLPGIEVTGTVPDVRPYYRDALAAVVPLRTGGGTRLKILEAMAAGIPVVSSTIGAEGLNVTPGTNILIADPGDSGAWVRHLTELQSGDTGKQLAARALELVKSRYDWNSLGQNLVATYEGWLRNP